MPSVFLENISTRNTFVCSACKKSEYTGRQTKRLGVFKYTSTNFFANTNSMECVQKLLPCNDVICFEHNFFCPPKHYLKVFVFQILQLMFHSA